MNHAVRQTAKGELNMREHKKHRAPVVHSQHSLNAYELQRLSYI